MTDIRELRAVAAGGMELRAADDGDGYTFTGYASMFDAPYSVRDNLGEYQEIVRSGAFSKAIKESDDCRLLINHEGLALARTKSGTLTLAQDATGLLASARLDPTNPRVAELKSAMSRGDCDQMSFAFQATRQEWNSDYSVRTILEAKLFDVSAVTYPASPSATASMRHGSGTEVETRSVRILTDAATQMRAGVLDPVTRDLLLQIIGAIDAGTEAIEDAVELLEAVAEVSPDADASDLADMLEGEDMQMNSASLSLLLLRAEALTL